MDELRIVPELIRTYQFANVIELIDNAIKLYPHATSWHSTWYMYRGVAKYFTSDFEAAAQSYIKALQASPNYITAHINLAHIYGCCPDKALHNAGQAIKLSRRACHLSRWNRWIALQAITTAYMRNQDFSTARRYAELSMALASTAQKPRVESIFKCIDEKLPFTSSLEMDLIKLKTDWFPASDCGPFFEPQID